jgi:hypothetical protein
MLRANENTIASAVASIAVFGHRQIDGSGGASDI